MPAFKEIYHFTDCCYDWTYERRWSIREG